VTGGIIAAGEGSRLRRDGWAEPKPLVRIAGVPLLETVVTNFTAAGIVTLTIIVNEDERACVTWARGRFPALDLRFLVKTTASSLESFGEVLAAAPPGPIVVSTVDAWCRPDDFAAFVRAAGRRPADATVLAVTPFVHDERPLWATLDGDGRLLTLGGDGGDLVTAGVYVIPARVRALAHPAGLGRLREYLAWLVASGEPVYGEVIERVIDVDRASDVTLAEDLVRMGGLEGPPKPPDHSEAPRQSRGAPRPASRPAPPPAACWGIFRERAHSPGRESDDAEILRLAGKHLEAKGLQVVLKTPDEAFADPDGPPAGVFFMCERVEALAQLSAWETDGVPHVNSPRAVLNTYRDRMIAQFAEAGVPFIPSTLVKTTGMEVAVAEPVWVKRADVHNTQEGDVVFARTAGAVSAALVGLAARGIERAVLQPHVPGDLIKFYGIGGGGPHREPAWFRWFHHKDQTLAGHPVDANRLGRLARQAAGALGLEIYGGDMIATADGLVLLDLNAWPSFALFRDEAAPVIADHLTLRFRAVRR
jgi:molybdopterin-guanine dinucleotide biosynthesis protein A